MFFDPLGYFLSFEERLMRRAAEVVVKREELLVPSDELKRTSLDYYAALRSLYFQNRASVMRKGRPDEGEDIDKIFDQAE